MTTTTKKITLSTVKSFIKNNSDNILINVRSRFDGMTDCVESVSGGFNKADKDLRHPEHTLGIVGAWFVGQSRDYFTAFKNDNFIGIEVCNSCGSFILAIPN